VDATADVLYGSAEEIFAKMEQYRRTHKYRVLELFREIDKNRDGDLRIQEVMRFVKRIVPDVTDVQAARFRMVLDVNGDGKVTYKEVREHVRTRLAATARLLGVL
jgi:Ca2+-binding EF-hand superfamily protein